MTDVILAVLLLAVIAAWLYRERENSKERAALCDRVQAPHVAQMAAYEQAFSVAPTPEPIDIYTETVPPERHNDLALEALLGGTE